MTPLQFATQLLRIMNLPVTVNNVKALVAWQALEGGHYANKARYNPLNTTQKMAGSIGSFGVGIQSYNSWSTGLAATAKTLSYGAYRNIVLSLANDYPPDVTLQYVQESPWGTKNVYSTASALYTKWANTKDPYPWWKFWR